MVLQRDRLLTQIEESWLAQSSAPRRFPSPEEVVENARVKYCAPETPRAQRLSELPTTGLPYPPKDPDVFPRRSGSHLYWSRKVSQDPVTVALKAEQLGYYFLASDSWLLAGDLNGALDCIPPREVGLPTPNRSDYRCCLSLILGRRFSPTDVLALGQSRLTDWAKNHPGEMELAMSSWLSNHDSELEKWIIDRPMVWAPWVLVSGLFGPSVKAIENRLRKSGWPNYSYFGDVSLESRLPNLYRPTIWTAVGLMTRLNEIVRDVENHAREMSEVPRVGEGWISESELHRVIVLAFGEQTDVIQHGSPVWLGRQHFDGWIPEWKVAIEYQGAQHDRPIEFFGGDEAWQANQKRDARKRMLCKKNGVTLIEVRPGYDLAKVLELILQAKPQG